HALGPRSNLRAAPRTGSRNEALRGTPGAATSAHAGFAAGPGLGEVEPDPRAAAGRRLRPDAPTVRLHDRARDRQAEAAAAVIAAARLVGPVEAVEDPLEPLGRNARTRVGDAELDVPVARRAGDRDPLS